MLKDTIKMSCTVTAFKCEPALVSEFGDADADAFFFGVFVAPIVMHWVVVWKWKASSLFGVVFVLLQCIVAWSACLVIANFTQ